MPRFKWLYMLIFCIDRIRQIMPSIYTSVIGMPTIAFLECLFAPTHEGYTGVGTISDWFPIQNPTPTIFSTGAFGSGDWLCMRFNLRACVPDKERQRGKRFSHGLGVSPAGIGFPLKRQSARIPHFFRGDDEFAVEYLLSVAIVLRKRYQRDLPSSVRYNVVVWLDYRTEFDERPERGSLLPILTDRVDLDLDLKHCGAGGAPFFQFLMVLTRVIDHWTKCWDAMIDKIDETIGVQVCMPCFTV